MTEPPESKFLELHLKSIVIRFNPSNPLLEDELNIIVKVIDSYIKHNSELK